MLGVDEGDELIDTVRESGKEFGQTFDSMILENLKTAGVQQAHKEDKIIFTSLIGWPDLESYTKLYLIFAITLYN